MPRIWPGQNRVPLPSKLRVARRRDSCFPKLAPDFFCGAIIETQIRARESLIHDGHPDEFGQRPSFTSIVRNRDHVPAACENDAGDASVEGLEKRKLAFIKSKIDHVATQAQRLDP